METLSVLSTIVSTFITSFDDRVTVPMLLSLLFTAFSVYAIYKVPLAISIVNGDRRGQTNSTITGANITGFVLGG